jgi:hypothetical protein
MPVVPAAPVTPATPATPATPTAGPPAPRAVVLTLKRTKGGLAVRVRAADGSAVTRARVVLQLRTAGSRAWRNGKAYRVDRTGRVTIRLAPPRRTEVRVQLAASDGYRAGTSKTVRLG